jgi:peptidoglycan/xylan/chitin deacetylase (PgdA/CDA1 family)
MAFLFASSFIIRSGVYVTTINSGNTNRNEIAITFDDGPCEQTREILSILDKHQAKASFFVIGHKIEDHKEIIKEIYQKDHTIGNHSFRHHNLFPLKLPGQIANEIITTQKIIRSITGAEPHYFRPPFGITNPLLAKALKGTSLKTIGWSIRSLDTVTDDPKKIMTRIKKLLKPGCIILLHDTTKNVIPVLEELLVTCAKLKLKPVSLDEFLHS